MQTTPTLAASDETGGTTAFYRHVMETLNAAGVPFLVGGAYAFSAYTGINRDTKDLDLFIRRQDYDRLSEVLSRVGYETEMTYPHWLAKIRFDGELIDLIFSSGNGISAVDDAWFEHAPSAEVLGIPVKVCPVEESIWSKAFIMERERFDGADIVHLLRGCSDRLDWQRLLHRFEPHWRVLLSHLTLFGFVYPAHRDLIPVWIMDELIERLRLETHMSPPQDNLCLGTLLSREQYLMDIRDGSCQDARLVPFGNMTPKDTAVWTDAIRDKE